MKPSSAGHARARALWPAFACAALVVCACADKVPGRVLAAGSARAVVASPAGGAVAFLLDSAHPDDSAVPQDLFLGDLWLSRDGAAARKIGGAVPSVEGGFAFDGQGGALAFLAGYAFRAGEGELWVAAGDAAPRRLADKVTAFAWSPKGGRLAFVSAGVLHVAPAAGGPAPGGPAPGGRAPGGPEVRPPVEGVHSFVWSPDGARLAARGPGSAGGRLFLVGAEGGAPVEVAASSSDFVFASDGALGILGVAQKKGGDRPLTLVEAGSAERRVLGRATSFGFSPSATELALLSTEKLPGESFGELTRLSRAPGSSPQPLGSKVSDYRWSAAGDLVYLARFDLRARAGTLLAVPPGGGPPRELSARVQNFSVQGRRLFYLVQEPQKADFKVELWTADLAAPAGSAQAASRRVDEGVYGYQLSPDGSTLYWKARCVGLRSCALFRGPADGSGSPVQLAASVAGFDLSADGARVLVAQVHTGSARAVDLRVLDARGPVQTPPKPPLLTEAEPGARFADAGGRRLIAVVSRPRAAVVQLDVP